MISCNVTYFNEPHFLTWWYNTIKRLENDYGIDVRLNICDDGSARHPAVDFFEKHAPTKKMRLFRVVHDIGFNSHGARNLLMKQTETDWNHLSDIDREYDDDTFKALVDRSANGILKRGEYYSFKHDATKEGHSLNEYFIHKDDFWMSGGYDEEFVNVHWGDRLFLESLQLFLSRKTFDDLYVKYTRGARNVSPTDEPLTQYPDDHTLLVPNNHWWSNAIARENIKAHIRRRNSTHEGRLSKKIIQFEWRRVF